MGRLLNRPREILADPFTDKVIWHGYLKAVITQIHASGIIKPDMEALLTHPLRDGISQSNQLRIVCG